MKHLFIVVFLFLALNSGAQNYETLTDRDSSKMYVGFINEAMLRADSAFKWYAKAQSIYTPKQPVVKVFADNKDSVQLLVAMGTWCEDSHFIIPRFYKILEAAGFDKSKVPLLAVDRNKKDKNNLAGTLNITHVPTIIVYKNGRELGRVVEYGNTGKYDEEVAALITGAKK